MGEGTALLGLLALLILLALLVRVAIGREKRWVSEALADDVALGFVTPEELETLGDLRRRRLTDQPALCLG